MDIEEASADTEHEVMKVEENNEEGNNNSSEPSGTNIAGQNEVIDENANVDSANPINVNKRKKTSRVWEEFKEVILADGVKKGECNHCKKKIAVATSGSTTQFRRHLDRCAARIRTIAKQNILHFELKDSESSLQTTEGGLNLSTFKYDQAKVREMIAHYILINEKPFSIVEEYGFNLLLKSMSPYFLKLSRSTARADVLAVYEKEKRKLRNALKNIQRISFTTDIWKSKNQRISYMAITAHYVDSSWKLQKRVLSFVHLPPPHTSSEIADTFYKAITEWGIENKLFTLSVDNASNNDRAVKLLMDSLRVRKKLFFEGRLFHVRCCAHILNLMVKDGIKSIEFVIEKIRETVSYLNSSEGRLMKFVDVVQQLELPTRKLIMDCPTRWNSTYNMLVIALQLKEAFFAYSEREIAYVNCPTAEEWSNIEKVCDILGFFNEATNIISGTEYPTSNLFLSQICTIKKVLNDNALSNDLFIREMTLKMKQKFDKYWGECNLLMAFGAVMDPRMKFVVIEFAYPMIYDGDESMQKIAYVRALLFEMYDEYATYLDSEGECMNMNVVEGVSGSTSLQAEVPASKKYSGWHDFTSYVSKKNNNKAFKI